MKVSIASIGDVFKMGSNLSPELYVSKGYESFKNLTSSELETRTHYLIKTVPIYQKKEIISFLGSISSSREMPPSDSKYDMLPGRILSKSSLLKVGELILGNQVDISKDKNPILLVACALLSFSSELLVLEAKAKRESLLEELLEVENFLFPPGS